MEATPLGTGQLSGKALAWMQEALASLRALKSPTLNTADSSNSSQTAFCFVSSSALIVFLLFFFSAGD